MKATHLPVLAEEVMSMLAPAPGSLQIDATLGGGGHTERILEATDPDGRLLGLDADGAAVARVQAAPCARDSVTGWSCASPTSANLRPSRSRPDSRRPTAASSTSGCRASSWPIRTAASVSEPAARSTCASIRHAASRPASCSRTLSADELTALFRRYGEEPKASRIARAIVEARKTAPVGTAEELAALVEQVVPPNPRIPRRTHPATRVFQALRIAVNEELEALQAGLAAALDLLRPGGRLVVLSYHSLEDRIVKRFFQAERRGCVCPPEVPICVCGRNPRLRLITRPSLTPTAAEIEVNPRARSARLRAAERLAA